VMVAHLMPTPTLCRDPRITCRPQVTVTGLRCPAAACTHEHTRASCGMHLLPRL
jgi:hypothetical protein